MYSLCLKLESHELQGACRFEFQHQNIATVSDITSDVVLQISMYVLSTYSKLCIVYFIGNAIHAVITLEIVLHFSLKMYFMSCTYTEHYIIFQRSRRHFLQFHLQKTAKRNIYYREKSIAVLKKHSLVFCHLIRPLS